MGTKRNPIVHSPVQETNCFILIDLYAQVLERRDEFLQVHFTVSILVQVRKLQPQVLLVLADVVDELGQAHISTVCLVGGLKEFLETEETVES